jgi:hypothetical protein
MPLQHVSAEFLAWAEHEGIDLTMLYERLQLTPTERLQRHQMALELVEALRHVKKGPRPERWPGQKQNGTFRGASWCVSGRALQHSASARLTLKTPPGVCTRLARRPGSVSPGPPSGLALGVADPTCHCRPGTPVTRGRETETGHL